MDQGCILELIKKNIARNSELLNKINEEVVKNNKIVARELDFCKQSTIDDLKKELESVNILLAADGKFFKSFQLCILLLGTFFLFFNNKQCFLHSGLQ